MNTRLISSLAVALLFAAGAISPAASQNPARFGNGNANVQTGGNSGSLSGQQPSACDCSNCSAEHCPKPPPPTGGGGGSGIKALIAVTQ